ncbi:hypothetical protein AHiyo4_33270 [Arthrobacter sp. Hiyo4]|nr:hypothetical protein AHiyo4_33270 [Arthrobacter sp. Hiyo4]
MAYTRAKHVLWVSSAAWVGSRAGRAEMSPFLAELERLVGSGPESGPGRDTEINPAQVHPASVDEASLPEKSPLTTETEVAGWPYDPSKDLWMREPGSGSGLFPAGGWPWRMPRHVSGTTWSP